MPELAAAPVVALLGRVVVALGSLFAAALIVYLGGDGYRDNASDTPISFNDAFYYATVSLSTTGYGDIIPVTPQARLVTALVITPLRLLFLIVLVGTTVELLTERSRQAFRISRWRSRVRDHTIIVGYGTKGRAAVETLLGDGAEPTDIVVVDTDRANLDAASALGLVTVTGNATRSSVLRIAGVHQASAIVVAVNRDDTAVLVTLTARELSPNVRIVASVRESENVHLLRQSGASSVVVSAETAGRLLGMATTTPSVVEVVEDLLTPTPGSPSASAPSTTRRSAARPGTCRTSSSAWSAATTCTAWMRPPSTPSKQTTASSTSARPPPPPRTDINRAGPG